MMNRICIFLIVVLAISCTGTGHRKQPGSEIAEEKKQGKLEQLLLLPRDSEFDYYDLSNDSIADFPDLSGYSIKSLDLSHNLLDTVIVNYLPKEIVTLNLSNNLLHNVLTLRIDDKWELPSFERGKLYNNSTIREIDLSHNNLTRIDIGFPLRKIVVSHNNITKVNFNHGNIEYIDISNNPNLSNVVQFQSDEIDTVIRNNIANDKELIPSNRYEPHYDYMIVEDSIK